jgi:hypothetical protein
MLAAADVEKERDMVDDKLSVALGYPGSQRPCVDEIVQDRYIGFGKMRWNVQDSLQIQCLDSRLHQFGPARQSAPSYSAALQRRDKAASALAERGAFLHAAVLGSP